MVDLSLIVATRRWDGLDITLNHAKRLNFGGTWELVLVDEYRNERKNLVGLWAKEHNINLIHVRPKIKRDVNGNPLPRTVVDYGNAYNTGLTYANGETVVLIEDFIGFKPDFIQNHYNFLKKAGITWCSLGFIYFVDFIPFEKRPEDITVLGCEGNIPRPNFATKDGIPYTVELSYRPANAGTYLENYIKINGFDERFDAAGWTDKEGKAHPRYAGYDNTAKKMARSGIYFHMDETVPTWHMDHGSIPSPLNVLQGDTSDITAPPSRHSTTFTPPSDSYLVPKYIKIHSLKTDPDFSKKYVDLPVHFNLAEERRKIRC